jgi:hypothetical protein
MVAPFLNIVTLCPQTYYEIVQGDLVIIDTRSVVDFFKALKCCNFSSIPG